MSLPASGRADHRSGQVRRLPRRFEPPDKNHILHDGDLREAPDLVLDPPPDEDPRVAVVASDLPVEGGQHLQPSPERPALRVPDPPDAALLHGARDLRGEVIRGDDVGMEEEQDVAARLPGSCTQLSAATRFRVDESCPARAGDLTGAVGRAAVRDDLRGSGRARESFEERANALGLVEGGGITTESFIARRV